MGIPLTRRGFAGTLGTAAGLLWANPRLGGIAEAAGRRPKPAGALPLNNNENPFGPNPRAIEAAVRACQSASHRYPDAIVDEAQKAIADSHGVKPEQVVLGCGSSEILQMADQAFLWPGKKAVVAETTFEAVLLYARAISGVAVKVPLTPDFRHDLPGMAAACDTATGLAYVCNPNNPTGTIVTGDEVAAFAAKVPPHVTILIDEAYHHFVEDPRYRSAASLIAAHPNVVVARTFSKIHGMAGLRLGYAVGSEERIDAMSSFASFSNTNVAVLAAGLASLADPEHLGRTRKLLNDNRRWLAAEMAKQGRRVMPSEANFVMVDLGTDVAPVIEAFRARKILVGRKFPTLATWLRVTVGKREELEVFATALAEIVPVKAAA
jgi:histidinol-phosphate aminotransferase